MASKSGMRVSRAITGATTVNANCYAEVTYTASVAIISGSTSGVLSHTPTLQTRVFGPSQSVPSSFTQDLIWQVSSGVAAGTLRVTWSLSSGVEFINS